MIRIFYKDFLMLFFTYVINCSAVEISQTTLDVADGDTMNISLSNYNKSTIEDQAFTQLININNKTNFVIHVTDIPVEVTFIIIQVHIYIYKVSVSYDKNIVDKIPGKFITGTNIGLLIETVRTTSTQIYVTNENSFGLNGLTAVIAHTNNAPYPGGCNMEFDIERSPFQKLVYNDDVIIVDTQPASLPKIGNFQPLCEKYPLRHDTYRMYMPEHDFSKESYFLAIANMLTVKDITEKANMIPTPLFGSAMRRVYSLYPGTGSVYGLVAYYANHSSAYIPIVTYGCDNLSWFNSCSILTTTTGKVICALSFFLGLFLMIRGYNYFKTSMFLTAMISGSYFGYIVAVYTRIFNMSDPILSAIFIGLLISLLWLVSWRIISSAIPSLIISGLALGSFFFYIFYFIIPVGMVYVEVNAYFWLLFWTFVILAILICSVIPLIGNILCFTIIGASSTILSIDYYSGSYLKYIIINGIRRATVSNFNVAVIQPPYQYKDLLLTIFWTFLVIFGFCKQSTTNWNRAPFPPSVSNEYYSTERTPLL